jgi:hypothetical protein
MTKPRQIVEASASERFALAALRSLQKVAEDPLATPMQRVKAAQTMLEHLNPRPPGAAPYARRRPAPAAVRTPAELTEALAAVRAKRLA